MPYKATLIKHSRGNYTTRIPQDEAILAMKDLSPKAYQLLIYYYCKQDGWRFDDDQIADAIDTSKRMIAQYRKELMDKEYLWYVKSALSVYFVGRQAVYDFKNTEESE